MQTKVGFPGGASGKESTCQDKRHKRCGFNPWVGKIPWRRKWQPTLAFLPAEFHGQKSPVGYGLWGYKELDLIECVHTHTHTYADKSDFVGIWDPGRRLETWWSSRPRRGASLVAQC